jgi:hypothetical protein
MEDQNLAKENGKRMRIGSWNCEKAPPFGPGGVYFFPASFLALPVNESKIQTPAD